MGNPRTITWYYNETAVKVYTSQQGELTAALSLTTGGALLKNGEYYAMIVNEDGDTFVSNTITLVYDELPIELGAIAITDDYKNADNMVLNTKDTGAVVTITMEKAYTGTFYLYEDSIKNYSTANATATTDLLSAYDIANTTAVTTADKLTEENALKNEIISYVAENGETTIMWAPYADLVRGKSYKIAFDQYNLDDDDIKATGRKDVDVTESALADYVLAPASIELVTASSGAPATVNLLDKDGNVMDFIGDPTDPIDDASDAGFGSFKVFGNDSASASTNKAAGFDYVKGGVITTENLKDYSYYQAELKTSAGVYGKDSVTLTSGFKAANVAIAAEVKLAENGTDPAQADITLKGVVDTATVYVVAAGDEDLKGEFDPDDSSTYRGSAEVKAGDGSATVGGVFAYDDLGDKFTAYVVPADSARFGRISSSALTLKENATSIEFNDDEDTNDDDATAAGDAVVTAAGTNNITINCATEVLIKDQFGKVITSNANFDGVSKKKATVTTNDAGGNRAEKGDATYDIDKDTQALSIALATTAGTDLGDGYNVELLGSKFKVTASTDLDTHKDFTVGLGSDTIVKPIFTGATTASVTSSADLVTALGTTNMVTVTIAKSLTTSAPVTVAATQKVVIPANTTLTTGDAFTLTGAATLDNSGTFAVGKGMKLTIDSANSVLDDHAGVFTVNDATALQTLAGATNFKTDSTIKLGADVTTTAAIALAKGIIEVPTGVTLTTGNTITLNGAAAANATLMGAGNVNLKHNFTITKGTVNLTGTVTAFDGVTVKTPTASGTDSVLTSAVFTIDEGATTNGVVFSNTDGSKKATVKYGPTAAGSNAIAAVPAEALNAQDWTTREGKVTITTDAGNVAKAALGASEAIPAA